MRIGSRIIIVGNTGSGKSTLGHHLSQQLNLPHTELDALHWEANWTPAEPAVFRQRVQTIIDQPRWIIDGNYHAVRAMIWQQADTLIWLDYPLWRIWWQLLKRTTRRIIWQETLWNGNRESWRNVLRDKDNLFLWALKKQWSRRRLYTDRLQQPEFAHLQVLRFYSPQETAVFRHHLKIEAG